MEKGMINESLLKEITERKDKDDPGRSLYEMSDKEYWNWLKKEVQINNYNRLVFRYFILQFTRYKHKKIKRFSLMEDK